MVPIILLSQCMFIVLLSMIGSGALLGMHGTRPGIGAITPVGGMHTPFGLTTTIGTIAMLSIITTAIVVSAMHTLRVLLCTICIRRSAVAIMRWHTPTVLSADVIQV